MWEHLVWGIACPTRSPKPIFKVLSHEVSNTCQFALEINSTFVSPTEENCAFSAHQDYSAKHNQEGWLVVAFGHCHVQDDTRKSRQARQKTTATAQCMVVSDSVDRL